VLRADHFLHLAAKSRVPQKLREAMEIDRRPGFALMSLIGPHGSRSVIKAQFRDEFKRRLYADKQRRKTDAELMCCSSGAYLSEDLCRHPTTPRLSL